MPFIVYSRMGVDEMDEVGWFPRCDRVLQQQQQQSRKKNERKKMDVMLTLHWHLCRFLYTGSCVLPKQQEAPCSRQGL